MGNVQQFTESITVPNTAKVVKFVLKDVDTNIENYTLMELEQFILDLKPNSPKAIITICYVLGLYARWLEEQGIVETDSFYQMIQSFDKKLLWKKAKPNANKKFISNEQFKRIIHEIGVYEDFNALYYECLFQCIYEGVYNDDLSVIKNLRGSDINDNIITLHEDNGHSYKIKVSENLASDLKKLSSINIWERRNRFGVCKVNLKGVHKDSVFKIEDRNTNSEGSYKFSYYAKLRKIAKEYLEYTLLPLQLYTSGMMYRIKVELSKNEISLEEAFSENSRNRMAHLIISKELLRCNSGIEVGNFRELVKGHLDSF
ncbi:MAG: hypothetical protein PUC23_03600 [bacterium]|nr:hypothetical protein [bacterium]